MTTTYQNLQPPIAGDRVAAATGTTPGSFSAADFSKLAALSPAGWFDARWNEMQAIDDYIDDPLILLGATGYVGTAPTPPTHLAWDSTVDAWGALTTDGTANWGYLGPYINDFAVNPWAVSFHVKNPATNDAKYCGFGVVNDLGARKLTIVTSFAGQGLTKFTLNGVGTGGVAKFTATTIPLDTAWHKVTIGASPSNGLVYVYIDGALVLSGTLSDYLFNADVRVAALSDIAGFEMSKIMLGRARP